MIKKIKWPGSGKDHFNWRGGLKKHKEGYILKLSKNHPNSKSGYVFEHRLVIEEKIGRYLRPDEIVHHKNGIKTDNRVDNLEVMTRADHKREHSKIKSEHILFVINQRNLGNKSHKKTADMLGVSKSTIGNIVKRLRGSNEHKAANA